MSAMTELRKALTTSGDGAALLPYDLDPVLHEELLKMQPLTELLSILPAGGKTHEYRVRSSHPQGWFEGETTGANNKNSVYASKTVVQKILRIWGSVTGFAQAMDEAFVDALAEELNGSVEGMANIVEYGAIWGAADDFSFTGDPYQFTGIIPRLFADASANVVDAGGDKITLDDLDVATSRAGIHRGLREDPRLWLMGQRMRQVVDGLQTRVQIPLMDIELADGKIRMASYDNQPIFETDFLVPASTTSSPSDLDGAPVAGGTLPDETYSHKISSVTYLGEQIASAETADDVCAAGNNQIDLTWTADANALLYMIWQEKSATAGTWELYDIIPAKTYNADGSLAGTVASYSVTGSKTVVSGIKPLLAGEQNILLVNRNPRRGVAFTGKVDAMGRPIDNLMSFVELARTKDTFDYMLKSYFAQRIVHPNVLAMIRHCKLA